MEAPVPEWVLWIAGSFGTMIGAFVARMGWKAAGGEKKPQTQDKSLVIEGALVDSSSVMKLAAAIEGVNLSLLMMKDQNAKSSEARTIMVAKAAEAISSLATNVAAFNRHSEEAEEKREEREKEDLKRRNEQLERDLREAQRAKTEGSSPR